MTGSLLALFYGSYRLIIRNVAIMRRNGMKDQRKRAWVESCKAIMVYVLNRLVQQFNGIP